MLDGISLNIDEGDFFWIKGDSGKGKSTLLNIIGLLDEEYKGYLEIDGKSNLSINNKAGRLLLKNDISYLFQNYGLVDNDTIYQNLSMLKTLSKSKNKKEKMLNALKIVGLNMPLNTKVFTLSGGEQQRVAMAKVILKDAKLILCDEPTGSVDEGNRNIILNILKEFNKQGRTIVIVSHDKYISKYATKTFEI